MCDKYTFTLPEKGKRKFKLFQNFFIYTTKHSWLKY